MLIQYLIRYNRRVATETQQKVTVMLPRKLLEKAMAATQKGMTPTIREGLEAIAAGRAFDNLRKRRGKVRFSISVSELRED
jgi:hypothetical protein